MSARLSCPDYRRERRLIRAQARLLCSVLERVEARAPGSEQERLLCAMLDRLSEQYQALGKGAAA